MRFRSKDPNRNVKCVICSKDVYLIPSRLKKRKDHCCSKTCSLKYISTRRGVIVTCENCNKEVRYTKNYLKKISHPSCSTLCTSEIRKKLSRGINNPNAYNFNLFERYFWDKLKKAESGAKRRGINFNLTHQFLIDLYHKQEGKCYYSGLKLNMLKDKRVKYDTLSLDRIDSSKGYTNDNVVYCLYSINMFKSEHSLDDIKKVFKAIMIKEQQEVPN